MKTRTEVATVSRSSETTRIIRGPSNVECSSPKKVWKVISGEYARPVYVKAVDRCMKRVKGVWIKDNGATHHMHHDKSLFTNYHLLKHRLYISGIGSGLKAVGIGDVSIKDPNSNERILKSVLRVPKLKCGVMSLNTLALLGWKSVIVKDGCTVTDGDFKIHGPIKNGLCIWGEPEVSPAGAVNALFASVTPKKLSIKD